MRFKKKIFFQFILYLGTLTYRLEAQVLEAINDANLATISSLTNSTNPHADSINSIVHLLFQTASFIEHDSQIISRLASDNTLVNSFEKFAYIAKGIFIRENNLNSKSFEVAIGEQARVGRIALYSDSTFKLSTLSLRWRSFLDGAQYTLRRLHASSVKEYLVYLGKDGSGCYEIAIDRKPHLFIKWNKEGRILKQHSE